MPPASYQTYILLANPGTTPATVTITFLRESGAPDRPDPSPSRRSRRFNVAVGGGGQRRCRSWPTSSSAPIITSTMPIVVERALYGDAGTQVFGIGTNATATPLP